MTSFTEKVVMENTERMNGIYVVSFEIDKSEI